jgi:hypothetical protein
MKPEFIEPGTRIIIWSQKKPEFIEFCTRIDSIEYGAKAFQLQASSVFGSKIFCESFSGDFGRWQDCEDSKIAIVIEMERTEYPRYYPCSVFGVIMNVIMGCID